MNGAHQKLSLYFCLVLPGLLDCGCASKSVVSPHPAPVQSPAPIIGGGSNCALQGEILVLTNQTITLPAEGRFVVESHLATTADSFPGPFPSNVTDHIADHLQRSCALLSGITSLSPGCKEVYPASYERQWTPPEGGLAGQGSVGNLKPAPFQEMFSGNMYWKSKPPPGTKFLACLGPNCVVVAIGWETGPASSDYLGGLQPEVFFFLKATDQSPIRWGRLVNQQLPLGPVECK